VANCSTSVLKQYKLILFKVQGSYSITLNAPNFEDSWRQAEDGPGPFLANLNYYFTSQCSFGRRGNAWNWHSSEEFEHNLHTCQVQYIRTVRKRRHLTEIYANYYWRMYVAWCIISLEKGNYAHSITIPLLVFFQFGPLIFISTFGAQ